MSIGYPAADLGGRSEIRPAVYIHPMWDALHDPVIAAALVREAPDIIATSSRSRDAADIARSPRRRPGRSSRASCAPCGRGSDAGSRFKARSRRAARRSSPRDGQVHLTARRDGAAYLIEVCDDGPGIPSEILPRIFEPFFTTKATGQGVGLGLSVSLGIVHEHQGRLDASNGPGGMGACFTVRLPLSTRATIPPPHRRSARRWCAGRSRRSRPTPRGC